MKFSSYVVVCMVISLILASIVNLFRYKPWLRQYGKEYTSVMWSNTVTSSLFVMVVVSIILCVPVRWTIFDTFNFEGGELVAIYEETVDRISIGENECTVIIATQTVDGVTLEKKIEYPSNRYILSTGDNVSVKEYEVNARMYSELFPFIYEDMEYRYAVISCPEEFMQ